MTWSDELELARYRGRALARAREELRVARLRWRDRRRLADNARAARQEAFAHVLGEAADASQEIVRVLEARLRAMEPPACSARRGGAVEAA